MTREAWPTIEEVVRAHLLDTIHRYGWNYTQVARHLGVGRTTLYRMLRRYKVVREQAAVVPLATQRLTRRLGTPA